MVYLLTMLATGLTSIITAFVTFFGRKAVTVALSISTFLIITAAAIICLKQLIFYVMTLAFIPAWISYSLGLFIPTNFAAVLAAILGARSCEYAIYLAQRKLRLINSAS